MNSLYVPLYDHLKQVTRLMLNMSININNNFDLLFYFKNLWEFPFWCRIFLEKVLKTFSFVAIKCWHNKVSPRLTSCFCVTDLTTDFYCHNWSCPRVKHKTRSGAIQIIRDTFFLPILAPPRVSLVTLTRTLHHPLWVSREWPLTFTISHANTAFKCVFKEFSSLNKFKVQYLKWLRLF